MSQYFETLTKDPGTANERTSYHLREDAPQWVRDAVYDAHGRGDVPPNDWIYGVCDSAFTATIIDCDPSDMVSAFVDGECDCYTKLRAQWYAEFCLSAMVADADERIAELGVTGSTIDRIRALQYECVWNIAMIVFQARIDNESTGDAP